MNNYGNCGNCGANLMPITFIETEYDKGRPTGRCRFAVSHLTCEQCLHNECVDNSFDGDWYYKK